MCEGVRRWRSRGEGAFSWKEARETLKQVIRFRSRWGPDVRGPEHQPLPAGPWLPRSVSVWEVPEWRGGGPSVCGWECRRAFSRTGIPQPLQLSSLSFVILELDGYTPSFQNFQIRDKRGLFNAEFCRTDPEKNMPLLDDNLGKGHRTSALPRLAKMKQRTQVTYMTPLP